MIAYDTSISASLIPASTCSGCPDKWYTESSSSTYDDSSSSSYTLDENNWVGTCSSAKDTVCLDNVAGNTTSCATALEFCLLTFEFTAPYDYTGALGLGLPASDYSDGANSSSFVEMWASEQNLLPAIVIDSNWADEESFIYFGEDPLVELRNLIGADTSALPNKWALNILEVDLDGDTYDSFSSSIALLESSY